MNMKYFSERKTVRRYSDKKVDLNGIEQMLNDAMRAPSTGNMQLYSAVITTDEDVKKQLAPAHFSQLQLMSAPVVITFCADFNRFVKWCRLNHAEPGYNNFQSFIAAALDAAIFAQQFNTIAEMNGLGCCYLGTTTYNAADIAKVLELPKMVVPMVTITVGYPADDSAQVERLPLEAVIHYQKYKDYTDADITRLYHDKEELEENKKFVAENNKGTLAQVFTDIRYNRKNNEFFSTAFKCYIEECGYPFPKE